jgi:hypothetical protein
MFNQYTRMLTMKNHYHGNILYLWVLRETPAMECPIFTRNERHQLAKLRAFTPSLIAKKGQSSTPEFAEPIKSMHITTER